MTRLYLRAAILPRSVVVRTAVALGAVLTLSLTACGSDKAPADTSSAPVASDAPAADAPASGASGCPAADGSATKRQSFESAPPMCIDTAKTYVATMDTTKGSMTFELLDERAPITVNSFVVLARYHYFDGIGFHRVVPDFVLQGGDPEGTGAGGPGYEFADELPQAGEYKIGSLAMANAGPNTNGSQFFVISGTQGTQLPPSYSLFGQLIEGQETVDAIAALGVGDGPPKEPVTINSVMITEK